MPDDYPTTLRIGDAVFRQEPASAADLAPAGIAYSYDTEVGPGLRRSTRVVLVRCPSCGEPLRLVTKGEFACVGPACGRTWYAVTVNEPGRSPVLALTTDRV